MKDWQKMALVALAVLGIAAAGTQRTPLNRAFLQSNMDANGFNITNLQGGVPGAIVAYDPDNGLMPTNVAVLSNAYVTNLITSNVYATNIYVITGAVDYLTVTNGLTNLALTPKTVLEADAGRQISSIANGAGVLVNDGAGNFSWNPAITGTQFVTNDGFFLHLWGTATNLNSPWALSNDGELFEGTNALAGSLAPGFHVFGAVAFSDLGQVPTQFFDILSAKDATVAQYGLINGAAGESPASASWSLLSGDPAGSTNNLGLQSHSGSAWFTAKVDATNRVILPYTGIWDSQGYVDESGTPGMLVAYGAAGRLVATNAVFTSNLYSTNISVSNIYATNIYVSVITNVDVAYITNLYVSTNFTTNLFVTYANITNLYVDIAYITNLYVNVAYITNLTVVTNTFNTAKGGTVYVTNLFVSATNFLGELTVTNGITNLSLTANTVLEADANRRISSIPNAAGALTNDAAGVVGWYPSYATQPGNNVMSGSNHFSGTITTSTNLVWGPDFSVEESCLSTNAAFTFAAPLGVDTSGKTVQWTLVNVTNTTAAAVLITSPANCHTVGTSYVTNWTAVWFQVYAQKITNAFYIPVF